MILPNERILGRFRLAQVCEWCGKRSRSGLDPHHYYYKRGMGGGGRIDIPLNLVSICRFPCHDDAERGRIRREDFLAIVARRENMDPDEVVRILNGIRRLPKTTVEFAAEMFEKDADRAFWSAVLDGLTTEEV